MFVHCPKCHMPMLEHHAYVILALATLAQHLIKDQKAVCHCLAAILNVADDSNKDASS